MPPRPFPYGFRVGTDIIAHDRIRKLITRQPPKFKKARPVSQLDTFLRRTFTAREIVRFWQRNPGLNHRQHKLFRDPVKLDTVVLHLAGRWAAKEAAIKAVKPRKLTFMDVEIMQNNETKELFALIRDKTFVHKPLSWVVGGMRRLDLSNAAAPSDVDLDESPDKPAESESQVRPAANDGTSFKPIGPESEVQQADSEETSSKPTVSELDAQQADSDETSDNYDIFSFPVYAKEDEDGNEGQMAILTISHDGGYATAVCVAPQENLPGDVGGEAAARLLYDLWD
ncbi:hypothetical protein CB0940_04338 [Cercospora beticola]|uniref:4'-phosphopantetheinyl transferase domain-containing protein n=1 Tax=Cercospora beticola TaxID=122368 RepID=A0A2G5HMM9_CERBT|nr:hypothetical protein CB0940_04338 [Cercospora beticola]PIA93804.1 hypothetical protein CB0940_04338 [Cercospora beticola]WPB01571.1 hypothetical protein RHO25_006199 [Cercospora beticola]